MVTVGGIVMWKYGTELGRCRRKWEEFGKDKKNCRGRIMVFGQKKTVKNENSADPVFLFSKGLPRAVLALVFNIPAHLA